MSQDVVSSLFMSTRHIGNTHLHYRHNTTATKDDLQVPWINRCRMLAGFIGVAVIGLLILTISCIYADSVWKSESSFTLYLCVFGIVAGLIMVGTSIVACSCCLCQDVCGPCQKLNRTTLARGHVQRTMSPARNRVGSDPPPYQLSVDMLEQSSHYTVNPHITEVVKPPPYIPQCLQPPQYNDIITVSPPGETIGHQTSTPSGCDQEALAMHFESNLHVTQESPPPYVIDTV